MIYALVAIDDNKDMVGTELCKEFEQFDGVLWSAIVRNAAERTESDNYVATYFTTTLALARLQEALDGDL